MADVPCPVMSHPPTQNLTLPLPTTKPQTTGSPKTKKIKMPKLRDSSMLFFYLCLFLILTQFSICNGASVLDLNALKGSEFDVKVGDCITEPEMESEISRRVLEMQKKYISYETLKRDLIPCARPGASYYNCHPVAANPYNRGCEVITRCRDTQDIKT
ncbi:protein RALF-like 24 [Argentina anserina]|uniref:protein RALF-like 24 n=1 Tax=Argentina anserina TaxID=57926 RepID=UPI002176909B|nr:protein RALF-like 24 [Potentilla anserina]